MARDTKSIKVTFEVTMTVNVTTETPDAPNPTWESQDVNQVIGREPDRQWTTDLEDALEENTQAFPRAFDAGNHLPRVSGHAYRLDGHFGNRLDPEHDHTR